MASASEKFIKVCLTNQGEDTETPWAEDLGPAPGPSGARKVRLVNVPFMHAKPTWGDTIVVSPVPEGYPTWDRGGVTWKEIKGRIVDDGGRWAMIVDYMPEPGTPAVDALAALAKACDGERLVCEGAWGPKAGDPGRVYLAVPKDLVAETVIQRLIAADLPLRLIQIHPEPKKLPRAQTVVGVTPAVPRQPARATTEPPAPKAKPKAKAKAAPPAKGAKKAVPAKAVPAKAAPAAKKAAAKAPAKKPAAKPVKKPAAKKPAKKR